MVKIDDEKVHAYIERHRREYGDMPISPTTMSRELGGATPAGYHAWLRRKRISGITTHQDHPGIEGRRRRVQEQAQALLPDFQNPRTTDSKVAKGRGINKSTVASRRRLVGKLGSLQRVREFNTKRIEPYVGSGLSVGEIAKEIGDISPMTVSRILRSLGEGRGRGGPGRPRGVKNKQT